MRELVKQRTTSYHYIWTAWVDCFTHQSFQSHSS